MTDRVTVEGVSGLSSWRAARAEADTNGWTLEGTGDWSWIHRSPDGKRAWRITPFDPAFRTFADICLASPNRHLPRVYRVSDHPEGGYSVIMEWLEPVSKVDAETWFESFEQEKAGTVEDARRLLEDAAAGVELPLFAGLDKNPDNVLRRVSDGTLVFTDAFWINGPVLYEMIQTNPQEALALYPADALEQWAHLPCMDEQATASILRAIGRWPATGER